MNASSYLCETDKHALRWRSFRYLKNRIPAIPINSKDIIFKREEILNVILEWNGLEFPIPKPNFTAITDSSIEEGDDLGDQLFGLFKNNLNTLFLIPTDSEEFKFIEKNSSNHKLTILTEQSYLLELKNESLIVVGENIFLEKYLKQKDIKIDQLEAYFCRKCYFSHFLELDTIYGNNISFLREKHNLHLFYCPSLNIYIYSTYRQKIPVLKELKKNTKELSNEGQDMVKNYVYHVNNIIKKSIISGKINNSYLVSAIFNEEQFKEEAKNIASEFLELANINLKVLAR